MTWIAAYVAAAATLLALDALWLGVVARGFYQRQFGPLLLDRPRPGPAAAFYAIYLAGVVFFAVMPALETRSWTSAAVHGALFGLVAYATYCLTNLATLRDFPARVVAPDLICGAGMTAVAALAGYAAASKFS